ncbi:hypothetical protein H0264_23590 [Nocardia huaxiensis]|uniref:Uncharacterized protein n=1 Tax=Nocardia huaxiensis TaxID=2755382 RepID=A0A7D6V751_9NOCA|nr:hypothetical protein [Nocardia huaxiensis]QLY28354.1 hypothetical protein H0264_23590 [Nocardia huaxiensis]
MGVIGELFPGKKLEDESGQSGDGQSHRPRVAIDLDAGVIRLSGTAPKATELESGDTD